MPRGDRRGPDGMGPMTGRGAGYCAGYDAPGYANPVGGGFGRGLGFRRGFGRGGGFGRRGWGRGVGPRFGGYPPVGGYYEPYYAPQEPVSESQVLKEQLAYYQQAVENLTSRLNELEDQEA